MRPVVATLLLMMMTLQVMYKGIVFSSYFANKAYIAAVLCENKEKPELQCEGKCYLKKQLQKTDVPESNASVLTLKLDASPFTSPSPVLTVAHVVPSAKIVIHGVFSENDYRYAYHSACFHPPRV